MVLNTVRKLEKYFGSTVNEKVYTVLNPAVRVIQGDGITLESIRSILFNLSVHRYSTDNVTFGCGGYLLQMVNRDILRFAMKASNIVVDGKSKEIYKAPKTDMTKASKAGRLTLVNRNNNIITIKENELLNSDEELIHTIFENGKLLIDLIFADIRN